MKSTIKIILLAIAAIITSSCDLGDTPPPSGGVKGIETVAGIVSNENGDPLEGIKIEIYYDKALKELYPDTLSWHDHILYTDNEGHYYQIRDVRPDIDTFDIYVVATDTAGIYDRQVKRGVMRYYSSPIWENGFHDISANAEVNFVLTKAIK